LIHLDTSKMQHFYPDWKYWEKWKHASRITLVEFALNFCKFYYQDCGNMTGGVYHIVLDDGNLDSVKVCLNDCIKDEDDLGSALGHVLLLLTEEEMKILYDHYGEYSGHSANKQEALWLSKYLS